MVFNIYFNFHGFLVGLSIYLFGLFLDNTISYRSKQYLLEKDKNLLLKGYAYTTFNLLVLNPIYYDIISKHLITNTEEGLNIIKYLLLLVIQSVGYYILHYAMHNNRQLRKIHKFHHKFTNVLIPSVGASVTISEYTFAYSTPFILGSYLVNSSLTTLSFAICTVSLLNIIIHCTELSNVKYYNFLVSPSDHFNHHKNNPNKKTYAAPFLNIDNFIDYFNR